ncbi:MAG: hypothetical protein HKP46_19490 [Myxococcales bacterium]|nr:hypothetical protein [Myxococcales bacterium]
MRFGSRSKLALCTLLILGCNGVIGEGGNLEPAEVSGAAPPRVDRDAGVGVEPGPDPGPEPMPDAGTIPDASVPPPSCDSMTAPPLSVRALRISDVTLNQAVSVPLVDNSAPVNARQAPVVADREGIVRVFVEPQPAWQARDVTARLRLGETVTEARVRVTDASITTALDSTINFTLAPGELDESTDFAVELLELDPCGTYAGDVDDARYPVSSTESLGVQAAPGQFRIVIVPVRYLADGSNRTPTADAETVARFTERMYGMFPLTDLDVSIREAPLDFENAIEADGQGWSELLNECLALRANDGAARNTYYYCAVRPSDDPVDFCARGCVAGLGPVPGAADTFNRAAIGLLYENGVDTFVHEIGHTLGLSHAPCGGVSGADPEFPYSSGGIGVPGFDIAGQRLFDTQHRDVMGYCGPVWISDYNYALLYDRLATVTASSSLSLKGATSLVALRPVIIDVDGTLSIGKTIWIESAPLGEALMVEWVGESGQRTELSATLVRVSHLPGGILYVPELADPPAAIRVPGYGTARHQR